MFKKKYIKKPSKISVRNIIAFIITVIGIALGVFIGINIIMAHVLGIANMVDNNTFTCVRLVYLSRGYKWVFDRKSNIPYSFANKPYYL